MLETPVTQFLGLGLGVPMKSVMSASRPQELHSQSPNQDVPLCMRLLVAVGKFRVWG